MSNETEKNLLDAVNQLSDIMPSEIEAEQLAAFILTILHGYLDTEDVVKFLRGTANVCEQHADEMKVSVDKHIDKEEQDK